MRWHRTETSGDLPADPLGDAVAEALTDVLAGAEIELSYEPAGSGGPREDDPPGTATAVGAGPGGWQMTIAVRLQERVSYLLRPGRRTPLAELLAALPVAGVHAAAQFRHHTGAARISPAVRRALRDTIAAEILALYVATRSGGRPRPELVAEIVEFLIEVSGTRVEAHELTHGVVIADVLHDAPRLHFAYPADIRAAKRAPLLFDGQRSVLVVDPDGNARTELQRHRFDRLSPPGERARAGPDDLTGSGSLVARATAVLGGLGFFVRGDRTIWAFAAGQPVLVRRGEHWTAFPLELTASIENMIGGGDVAGIVARAAFMVSAQPGGGILAIVAEPASLEGVVSPKDRYDLRNQIDPDAMRPETRLHHLIDAEDLDERTLARLATLDGATVLDREGRLLAYGAIVTSSDSQHEGARTAAARTLSETALVVLKVSVDGDITIFRDGTAVTTLLGRAPEPLP